MITTAVGRLAKDAERVTFAGKDYLKLTINDESRSDKPAVWVTVLTAGSDKLAEVLRKGATIVATGRYSDKAYDGRNGAAIDRTLWSYEMRIASFAPKTGDDLP